MFALAAAFHLPMIGGRGWLVFGGIVSLFYGAVLVVAPNHRCGRAHDGWTIARRFWRFPRGLAFRLRARLDNRERAIVDLPMAGTGKKDRIPDKG